MQCWKCRSCSTVFEVGQSMCPRCTGTDIVREESLTVHLAAKVLLPVTFEKETPWPGSSSSTSPVRRLRSGGQKQPKDRSRARTTASRSKSTAASSTARGATTSTPD